MQKPPSPEPLAKFCTICCPPVELVKLSNDVGSCKVEIIMATAITKSSKQLVSDDKLIVQSRDRLVMSLVAIARLFSKPFALPSQCHLIIYQARLQSEKST